MFSRVLTTNRESTGTSLKDPGSSKRSTSNIGEIVWCDTFNAWCALLYINWALVRKPETPPLQTRHETISFPL